MGAYIGELWDSPRAKNSPPIAHQKSLQGQIDHRLKQQINEKKLALGLKIERPQKPSYQTEEEYEQSM